MSRFLKSDDIIDTPNGRLLVMSLRNRAGLVELLNLESKEHQTTESDSVRKYLAAGTWSLIDAQSVRGVISVKRISNTATEQHARNSLIVQKLKWFMSRAKSLNEAIKALKASGFENLPSDRGLYRLMEKSRKSENSLIPRHGDKGNRVARYSTEIVNLLRELVEFEYAVVQSRITLKSLTNSLNIKAKQLNLIDEKRSISGKFVRHFILNNFGADLDLNRLDPRLARSAKAVAANRIRPGGCLHRVEMDALHLPFIVKIHDVIIETLYLLHAIDCFTGHSLGGILLKAYPTVEDTLHALEIIMFPKDELFRRLNINSAVNPYGTPIALFLDNGPENKGERIDNLACIGIDVTRTAAHSGHEKPFIEQSNKGVKTALEALPGCTRFNSVDGARTEAAKKDELMSFAELERWIFRYLFEKAPHQVLERFVTPDYDLDKNEGITPAQRWQKYEEAFPLPLAPNRKKWMLVWFERTTRSISPKTGVSFSGYRFRGDNLVHLVRQYGPNADVIVYFTPSDYRTIYVPDKETKELLVLVNDKVTGDSLAFTFKEAKQRQKYVRAREGASHPAVRQFDQDRDAASLTNKRAKSRKVRMQEQHQIARLEQAVQRRDGNPLPRNTESEGTSNDVFVAQDEIPQFSVVRKTPK